jgi:uncharacterized protein YggT (Ycf19 family)
MDNRTTTAQAAAPGIETAASAIAVEPDFAAAAALSRSERGIVQRLSKVLRFNDFMTFMMVIATALSAFATWRTAEVTNLLFSVAERPYIGIEKVSLDGTFGDFARVAIDCRNFGNVSATRGVARVTIKIDGKELPQETDANATNNIGMVSPSVPQLIFRFIPIDLYRKVSSGQSRMVVHVLFTYRGPDRREFCYDQLMTYDQRSASFISSGGTDRCGGRNY